MIPRPISGAARIIPALDSGDAARAQSLAETLAPHCGVLKVGLELFTSAGPGIVSAMARHRPVFLDLKLHDIPNTVAGAERPMLLAVTVLTSIDAETLAATGVAASPADQVLRLARLAVAAGADGLVCSPQEAGVLRAALGPAPFLVVPGVRPAGAALGDQARTATPAEAVAAGADWIVVGRPITGAADPAQAAAAIAAGL